jgi:hypothetical protein
MTTSCSLAANALGIVAWGDEALRLKTLWESNLNQWYAGLAVAPPFDELSPTVAVEISRQWSEPCEAVFEFLAENHPPQLLKLIASNRLRATDLTFAAEIAGRLADSTAVRRTLLPLLSHADAVVREGAIYGLAPHADQTVRSELARLSASDPSPAVRQAATDTLADL